MISDTMNEVTTKHRLLIQSKLENSIPFRAWGNRGREADNWTTLKSGPLLGEYSQRVISGFVLLANVMEAVL